METRNLVIAFVDLANYTGKTAFSSREQLYRLLEIYERLVEPIFPKFGGRIIKKIGDSFMVAFESPTNAVLCGMEVQNILFEHNQRAEKSEQLMVKIAIDMGEVQIRKGDLFGDAVNIASRMEKVSEVGNVYFTDTVYLAMNKSEIPYVFLGKKKFKGVPRKIGIFKVLREYTAVFEKKREKMRSIKKLGSLALIVFILSFGIYFLFSSGILSFYSISEFFKNIYNFFREIFYLFR